MLQIALVLLAVCQSVSVSGVSSLKSKMVAPRTCWTPIGPLILPIKLKSRERFAVCDIYKSQKQSVDEKNAEFEKWFGKQDNYTRTVLANFTTDLASTISRHKELMQQRVDALNETELVRFGTNAVQNVLFDTAKTPKEIRVQVRSDIQGLANETEQNVLDQFFGGWFNAGGRPRGRVIRRKGDKKVSVVKNGTTVAVVRKLEDVDEKDNEKEGDTEMAAADLQDKRNDI